MSSHRLKPDILFGKASLQAYIRNGTNVISLFFPFTRNSEADFEDFLNNLYNHSKSTGVNTSGDQNSFRGDSRRRKTKRKK